jgi:hypothetical protein
MVYWMELGYNRVMVITGLISWWYGDGWTRRVKLSKEQFLSLYDYFSIDLLIRTWFAPFRQISAGQVSGPLGVQLRAWFDQVISRTVGGVVRTIVIVCGSVALLLSFLLGVAAVVGWALVPVAPLIGLVMSLLGWAPWHI